VDSGEHRRLRSALNVGFTAAAVRGYEPVFKKVAESSDILQQLLVIVEDPTDQFYRFRHPEDLYNVAPVAQGDSNFSASVLFMPISNPFGHHSHSPILTARFEHHLTESIENMGLNCTSEYLKGGGWNGGST
jgi:hypothetical protein